MGLRQALELSAFLAQDAPGWDKPGSKMFHVEHSPHSFIGLSIVPRGTLS